MGAVVLGRTVLIVDDDRLMCAALARDFRARGCRVHVTAKRDEALEQARTGRWDVTVVDLFLGEATGLDVIAELRAIEPKSRIVVLTGYASVSNAVEALRLGATHFLPKPATAVEILEAADGQRPAQLEGAAAGADARRRPTLADAETSHIQRVLDDCGGNISEAARVLGIHRRTLQRKLQKLS
jgi:two-component system, response regulator RegA